MNGYVQFGSNPRKRLFQICNYIINMFYADGQSDQVRRQSTGFLLRLAQLGMSGARRMDHKAFGISHIGKMRKEFQIIYKFTSGSMA